MIGLKTPAEDTLMYMRFYELNKRPFAPTPDPEFLYSSVTHREALAKIICGVEDMHGFIAITGDVGLGKTTVIQAYLQGPHAEQVHKVVVYNPDLSFDELLSVVYRDLDLGEKPDTTAKAVDGLHVFLIDCYERRQKVVLIIDEAQNMPVKTLESIRMLSNLETAEHKLLQIVLCGQTEFAEMLNDHNLRQLRQRISLHARLEPLSEQDAREYISFRLQKAAYGNMAIMAPAAIRAIARASQGIPRIINNLAEESLVEGVTSEERPISAKTVQKVVEEYQARFVPHSVRAKPTSSFPSRRVAVWALPILILLIAAAAAFPFRETMVGTVADLIGEESPSGEVAVDAERAPVPPPVEQASAVPDKPSQAETPSAVVVERSVAPDAPAEKAAPLPSTEQPSEEVAVMPPQPSSPPPQDDDDRYRAMETREVTHWPAAAMNQRIPATDEETVPRNVTDDPPEQEDRIYVVRPGDNLTKIIRSEYGFYSNDLLEIVRDANPEIRNINFLNSGDRIVLPPANGAR